MATTLPMPSCSSARTTYEGAGLASPDDGDAFALTLRLSDGQVRLGRGAPLRGRAQEAEEVGCVIPGVAVCRRPMLRRALVARSGRMPISPRKCPAPIPLPVRRAIPE